MDWNDIEKLLDKVYEGRKTGEEIEGQNLDVKRCRKKIEDVIHFCRFAAICFANAQGGSLILGVENNIKGPDAFTGCPPDFNVWEIDKGVREGTSQPVHVQTIYHNYKGVNLLEMIVPEGLEGAHALKDGRIWRRSGRECLPFTPEFGAPKFIQPEKIDYSKTIINDVKFDDLDKKEINILREQITKTEGSLDFLRLKDNKDFLKALGLIYEGKDDSIDVTLAALLFVGTERDIKRYLPCSELVFIAYGQNGKEQTEVRFCKGLLSMVLDFQKLYDHEYNTTHHLDTGLFEIEIPKIPNEVLRESLLNAMAHREYKIQSSIFFKNYPDKIEIINPGDFCGDITPHNILTHSPIWRNFLISEVFLKIGLVRKLGLGVDRIYRYLLNHGKESPIYYENGQQITLTIYDRIDEGFAKYLQNLERNNQSLPLDEMIILSKLKGQDKISTIETADAIQRSDEDAKNILNKMYHERKLGKGGTGRGTYYRLSAGIYKELEKSIDYVRNGDIEKRRQKEMILEAIRNRGLITNQEVQNLLGIDRDDAYQILKELKNDGKIKLLGEKKKANYVLTEYKF